MSNRKSADLGDSDRLRELRLSTGKEYPPEPVADPQADQPKGRQGMKGVVIYLSPAQKATLARIAKRERRTVQELGTEAINLLFQNRGEKPVA